MDIATVGLAVDGSQSVRMLDRFSDAAGRAGRQGDAVERMARRLSTQLTALGIGFGGREVIQYADQWNMVAARMRLVTQSSEEARAVQHRLMEVANNTRQSFGSTAELYLKVAREADALGKSQADLLRFTEAVNMSMVVGGTSAREAAAGTYQLAQALASGRLQGDEFRSMMENMPELARMMAKGLEVSRRELRQMSRDGELTSEVIVDAMLKMSDEIEAAYQDMPMTIGQAFTIFGNQIQAYIANVDDANSASGMLSSAVLTLGENLETVGRALLAVGVTYVARYINGLLAAAKASMVARQTAVAASMAQAAAARNAAMASAQEAAAEYKATEATRASTAAEIQSLEARRASLALYRQEAVARLQAAQAITRHTTASAASLGPLGGAVVGRVTAAREAERRAMLDLRRTGAELKTLDDQLRASKMGLTAATTANTAAQVRLTTASVAAGRAQATYAGLVNLSSRAMTIATTAARGLWTALGGFPGAVIVSMLALYELFNRNKRAMVEAKREADAFRSSLLGLGEAELLRQLADVETQVWEITRAMQAVPKFTTKTMFTPGGDIQRQVENPAYRELAEQLGILEQRGVDVRLALDDVADAAGRTGDSAEELDAKMQKLAWANEDMVRKAQQKAEMAHFEGLAQERLKINYDALNKSIEAQREQKGEVLAQTLAAIESERQWLIQAATIEDMYERLGDRLDRFNNIMRENIRLGRLAGTGIMGMLVERRREKEMLEDARREYGEAAGMILSPTRPGNYPHEGWLAEYLAAQTEEARRVVENFVENVQSSLAEMWRTLITDGVRSIGALLGALRQGLVDVLSEGLAAGMMRRLAPAMTTIVGTLFGAGNAAAQGMTDKVPGWVDRLSNKLDEFVNKFHDALMDFLNQQIAGTSAGRLAGAGAIGLGVGYGFGGTTSNRMVGAAGGALGGAAAGFMVAGPLGAAIGGLTGAIGGLMGSTNRHREELRRQRQVMEANNARLEALRESFNSVGAQGLVLKGESLQRITQALSGGIEGYLSMAPSDMASVKRLAEQLGITIMDEKGRLVAAGLEALNEALELTIRAMLQWGNNLSDIQKRQQAENLLYGVENTPEQAFRDVMEQIKLLSPALFEQMGLAGIDITTQVGREQAMKAFQALYELIASGQLTPELLGAFTDKNQLIDTVLAAARALQDFNKTVLNVTTDFPRAMDLMYYEQTYGRGTGGTVTSPAITAPGKPTDTGGWQVSGGIHITIKPLPGVSGEEILTEVEKAVQERAGRGGFTYLPNTVTEEV